MSNAQHALEVARTSLQEGPLHVTARLPGAERKVEPVAAKAVPSQGADSARHAANDWLSAIRFLVLRRGVLPVLKRADTTCACVVSALSKDLRARSEEIFAMQNRSAALRLAEAIQSLKSCMRVDVSLEKGPCSDSACMDIASTHMQSTAALQSALSKHVSKSSSAQSRA
eukprot:6427-Heterococcus_DN1.PRE.8